MSMEELLKKLKSEYIAELPKKISAIEALVQNSSVPDLLDAFHKLKGTGRTYGIPEVSQLAELVEGHCRNSSSEKAVSAAKIGALVLRDIFQCRSQQQGEAGMDLEKDDRFAQIKAL